MFEMIDFLDEISFPGQYPYTRGLFPAGYRTRGLHIRQVTGFGTAEETNERWEFLLSQGANEPIATMREYGGWLEKVVLPSTAFTITKPFLMVSICQSIRFT